LTGVSKPQPAWCSFCLWQYYNYKQQAALHLLTSCRLQNNTMLQLIKNRWESLQDQGLSRMSLVNPT